MALVISDAGLVYFQDTLRVAWNAAVLRLHLFQNNITPNRNNVLSDFTEATFDGYTAQNVSTWGPVSVQNHIAFSVPINYVFTKAAGSVTNSIFGYYVTNPGNTLLLWAERDPAAPFVMSVAGTQYSVQLLQSQQNLPGIP